MGYGTGCRGGSVRQPLAPCSYIRNCATVCFSSSAIPASSPALKEISLPGKVHRHFGYSAEVTGKGFVDTGSDMLDDDYGSLQYGQ